MRSKIANFILAAIEIGCVTCMTGIAVNAEWKRHKAEKALLQVKLERSVYEFGCFVRERKIKNLEKELEELKAKKGEA